MRKRSWEGKGTPGEKDCVLLQCFRGDTLVNLMSIINISLPRNFTRLLVVSAPQTGWC